MSAALQEAHTGLSPPGSDRTVPEDLSPRGWCNRRRSRMPPSKTISLKLPYSGQNTCWPARHGWEYLTEEWAYESTAQQKNTQKKPLSTPALFSFPGSETLVQATLFYLPLSLQDPLPPGIPCHTATVSLYTPLRSCQEKLKASRNLSLIVVKTMSAAASASQTAEITE